MEQRKKLTSAEQQSRQSGTERQVEKQAALEFATAEELLRYDASRVTVPERIEQRLQESVGPAPPRRPPWWKRWFGGAGE